MRVLVVFGGRSGEHEVSISSACAIVEAVEGLGHEPVGAGITFDGRWVSADPRAGAEGLRAADPFPIAPSPGGIDADVAFPVLHGPHGEDGSVQGLFDLVAIPYVGAGIEGSAICLNKVIQKRLFVDAGLPVVDHVAFHRDAWPIAREALTAAIDKLGFPCFTKPVRLGSSVGISKVHDRDELADAVERALRHDDDVIVEAQSHPRELEVGVLGDPPEVSLVGEVVADGEFYDYRAKYQGEWTELTIPADVPEAVAQRAHAIALEAFEVSRCEGLARVDFFYDPAGEDLVLNEINSIPGLTPNSMFPRVWERSGRSFAQVVDVLIGHALARHARRTDLEAARAAAHDQEIGAGTPRDGRSDR